MNNEESEKNRKDENRLFQNCENFTRSLLATSRFWLVLPSDKNRRASRLGGSAGTRHTFLLSGCAQIIFFASKKIIYPARREFPARR